MQITTDVSKISRTVQRDLTFISFSMFFQNLAFIFLVFNRILLVSHEVVFIENETVLLCVTMCGHARACEATI